MSENSLLKSALMTDFDIVDEDAMDCDIFCLLAFCSNSSSVFQVSNILTASVLSTDMYVIFVNSLINSRSMKNAFLLNKT